MKHGAITLVAIAVAASEVVSVGMAVTPVAAQTATQEQRQISRQQRLILQQQRQIQQNQRQLQAQQQQLGRRGEPASGPIVADQSLNRGIFGNIGGCPVGYTYNLFSGCLPTIVVLH